MAASGTPCARLEEMAKAIEERWPAQVALQSCMDLEVAEVVCQARDLPAVCQWLCSQLDYTFATLVVQDEDKGWMLRYVFCGAVERSLVSVLVRIPGGENSVPSIASLVHAADWHEREAEDLFGLVFEGHPKLGDFVLHEEWPEGVNPMLRGFDGSKPYPHRELDPDWRPSRIVQSPGAFVMPIGPVYSDYAESAHFLLETVGEDVIRTIPRFYYKYRGVEKIAQGRRVEEVLLLAERFSGTSAFAHSLAFCQAVERAWGLSVPERARMLRIALCELERFRHHVHAVADICNSTGLGVATSQASILEEELLRLSCVVSGHRYLFGLNVPGGLAVDLAPRALALLENGILEILKRFLDLEDMLRFSSSFLDRLEEVGVVSPDDARAYGLVGPVARASGIERDLRKVLPYSGYERIELRVPCEAEGDSYARLRVLFREAEQSAHIVGNVLSSLPQGPVSGPELAPVVGSALGWVEAPRGATFHWVCLGEKGTVARYRLSTPSFTNWHGFHLAAENFAFQDFPIIMASFGLSNAESDR
jgi:formate hydrogenlyase subunit 5